jgi:hypothetical protein
MEAVRDGSEPRDPRLAGRVLLVAAAFGAAGDGLFHDSTLGLNAALWLGGLALAGWLTHRRVARPAGALPALLATGAFFGGCLAWRGSPFLRLWNAAAVAAAVTAVAVQLRGTFGTARIADYARGAMAVAGAVVAEPVRLLAAAPWLQAGTARRRAPAIATGALLAVPVVLVFGSLLAAADPAMDAFVRSLFTWDLEAVVAHLAIFGAGAWLTMGALWRIGRGPREPAAAGAAPTRLLGAVEVGIPLGALTLLLTLFVGLQTRYLFGGGDFVRLTGITYAQFARRGFFELVAVCALVLPVLVAARHVTDRGARASVDSFRALLAAVAILVGLVMVSALARMRLYVMMYGLTEDRFYASACMLWLGAVLAWLVLAEFRGGPERFATGAVIAGFLLLGGLNAANPDAVVARVNLDRAAAGADLDATYLGRLSSDAVPTLVARWSTLDRTARCALWTTLAKAGSADRDWRAWTWSAWRAARSARAVPPPGDCGG